MQANKEELLMAEIRREEEMYRIPDENGDEHLFAEIFRMTSDRSKKTFVVLEPVGNPETEDEDDDTIEVYAFEIEELEDGEFILKLVEDDDDFEEVMEAFDIVNDEVGLD